MARGFAALTPERQREIASLGGKAAHAVGRAHQWTQETAREAGRKGGVAVQAKYGRNHMAEIGREGGNKLAENKARMAEMGRKGGLVAGKRRRRAAREAR